MSQCVLCDQKTNKMVVDTLRDLWALMEGKMVETQAAQVVANLCTATPLTADECLDHFCDHERRAYKQKPVPQKEWLGEVERKVYFCCSDLLRTIETWALTKQPSGSCGTPPLESDIKKLAESMDFWVSNAVGMIGVHPILCIQKVLPEADETWPEYHLINAVMEWTISRRPHGGFGGVISPRVMSQVHRFRDAVQLRDHKRRLASTSAAASASSSSSDCKAE
jgi:hypothetical protein